MLNSIKTRFMNTAVLMGILAVLAACGSAASMARAQSANLDKTQSSSLNSGADYVLSVHSDLVLLDVVVHDKKGNPVLGLQKSDFNIYEDKVLQNIITFEHTEELSPAAVAGKQVHSTTELDRTEPDAPVSIVILDEVTTKFEERFFARYALQKYLGDKHSDLTQPMMLVARNMDHIMVLSDYTTSKKEILSALDRHLAVGGWQSGNPSYLQEQFLATFATLMEIAKATQGHPGHKNLIWVGHGLPTLNLSNIGADDKKAVEYSIAQCANLLKNSRITIYSIDPAGIAVSNVMTLNSDGDMQDVDPFAGQIDFDSIVNATGGQSLHGRNDVDQMLDTSVRNGENFYTMAYQPQGLSGDNPMKFRRIRVVPVNPEYTAISRTGYYSAPPQHGAVAANHLSGSSQDQEDFDIMAAISNLMVFDGIPLTIAKDAATTDLYHVSLPANRLGLTLQDGKFVGNLRLDLLGYDRLGKLVSKNGKVLMIHLDSLDPGTGDSKMVTINTLVKVPAGTARVRIIVRAKNSGYVGADNIYLVDKGTLKDPLTGLKAVGNGKN